jgi:cytochrome P450
MEFLPERFDHSSPLSLTPGGKKRHPMSWVPFHGGSRVCFGKTLAEANMKILMLYLTD